MSLSPVALRCEGSLSLQALQGSELSQAGSISQISSSRAFPAPQEHSISLHRRVHRGVCTLVDQGRSMEWERAEQGCTVLAPMTQFPTIPGISERCCSRKKKSWKAEEVQRKWTTGGS